MRFPECRFDHTETVVVKHGAGSVVLWRRVSSARAGKLVRVQGEMGVSENSEMENLF